MQEAVLFPYKPPPATASPAPAPPAPPADTPDAGERRAAAASPGSVAAEPSVQHVDPQDEEVEVGDWGPISTLAAIAAAAAGTDPPPAPAAPSSLAAPEGSPQLQLSPRGDLLEAEAARRAGIDMFQSQVVGRLAATQAAGTGTGAGPARAQRPWDRLSWPRCGWWVAGQGAFAVEAMSDCPVLTPFQPLGEFIIELGRRAPEHCSGLLYRF